MEDCQYTPFFLTLQSVQTLENKDDIRSVPVPHVKVRKLLVCGGRLGRFRRPENIVCWIAQSNIFQKKRGAISWGLCAYLDDYGKCNKMC